MKAAQARIFALVSGLPEPKRSRRILMALQAFIDDSRSGNTNLPGSVFVLAGYIADVSDWLKFSNDWQAVLDGPPSLEVFKMSHFVNRFGLYDERLCKFRKVIERHVKASVTVTLDYDAYRRFVSSEKTKSNVIRNPYYLTLVDLVIQLKRAAHLIKLDSKIEFIFDEQAGDKEHVRVSWAGIKVIRKDIGDFIGNEPRWEKEEEFLPLQAADKLAWWVRRHREETLAGKPLTQIPWETNRHIPDISWVMDEAQLARIFNPS